MPGQVWESFKDSRNGKANTSLEKCPILGGRNVKLYVLLKEVISITSTIFINYNKFLNRSTSTLLERLARECRKAPVR